MSDSVQSSFMSVFMSMVLMHGKMDEMQSATLSGREETWQIRPANKEEGWGSKAVQQGGKHKQLCHVRQSAWFCLWLYILQQAQTSKPGLQQGSSSVFVAQLGTGRYLNLLANRCQVPIVFCQALCCLGEASKQQGSTLHCATVLNVSHRLGTKCNRADSACGRPLLPADAVWSRNTTFAGIKQAAIDQEVDQATTYLFGSQGPCGAKREAW